MSLCAIRYTQIDSILDTLRANPTKNIVFVGNNVRAKALSDALPDKNVLFAFASSAGHREQNRVVSVDLKKSPSVRFRTVWRRRRFRRFRKRCKEILILRSAVRRITLNIGRR